MDRPGLYRDIVESSPDGIWAIDLHGETVYANPEIARIHRVPLEQLKWLQVTDTLDEAGRLQFASHLADVRAGRINEGEVEVQWIRNDGTIVWMLVRETAVRDEDGQVVGLLHRYTDHTEQRELIESLRAGERALEDEVSQNELLQAVASAANEAGSLGDILRQARSLVLLHDDWERARGFVPREGVLVPYYAVDSDRLEDEEDPFAEVELALARRCYEERRLLWDERKLTVVVPILLEEDVYAVVAITSAPPLWRFELIENMAYRMAEQLARVAERERAQTDLARARDQAMEASRQKSEFLATMSHEIRTPLNGVIGLNDLLLRSALAPEQQRLATGVQVASRALLGVINDILDFSKIEAGRLELEWLDFAVRPLLDHVAALLAGGARDKGLDLVVSCHADVPVALSGDPTRLAQVVTNLVSNAVKFTERGGVAVAASSERVDGRVRLKVEVSDTGIGVRPDSVANLFDPFTQADTSTSRLYGGTGLGLAISRELVEAMGGELRHRANPGGGSIFSFTALLDEAQGADPSIAEGDEDARRVLAGLRALVVNDTPDYRPVLDEQLQWWGMVVERVSSVPDGLSRLAHTAYDVVLLDLAHPQRDGTAVARQLRGHPGRDKVVLLMLTSAVAMDVAALRDSGIDEVLVRPVLAGALRSSLLQLVAGESLTEAERPPAEVKGRVLVVEDNAVNQMVASGLLSAFGYASVVVDDGLAAIEAAASEDFDAILMDVQMPRMDGYVATRAIRAAEGEHRRPIIAMTAAAVEGERERCLEAGMDDFVTKPVDPAALAAVLQRWIAPDGVLPELDHARLDELRTFDPGSNSYLDRAIENFLGYSRANVEVLAAAVAAGDVGQVRALAHRLAGGALNLGAAAAGEALRELELLANSGSVDDALPLVEEIGRRLERAREALIAYRATWSVPAS